MVLSYVRFLEFSEGPSFILPSHDADYILTLSDGALMSDFCLSMPDWCHVVYEVYIAASHYRQL